MKTALERRLVELESEHQTGQKMLADLDDKRQKLTQTLLRIDGAIAVLRELLAQGESAKEP